MAHVLDKYQITRKLASRLIAPSDDWFRFHLSISILCIGVSAIVSNVAASVLVTAMIGSNQKRALLTIAFACNIGGMILPIASPQNLIAIASLHHPTITFYDWMIFSVPMCAFGIVIAYMVLQHRFGSISALNRDDDIELSKTPIPQSPRNNVRFKFTPNDQIVVSVVVGITVLGWIFFDQILSQIFSHMGIWGIFTMSFLFAFGYLGQSDWQNGIPWHVVALLGGGLVLGEAVKVSGLLDAFHLPTHSSSWLIYNGTLLFVGLVANFLSSTVCALVTMPVVAKIGIAVEHPKLFVIAAAIMTSGAMSLPVSSFPNANAAAVALNQELTTRDFIRTGGPITGLIWLTLVTFGFVYGIVLGL